MIVLESICKAIKFKPQRQNVMNAAATLLIWHFTAALLPLAYHPPHGPLKADLPTLTKCVSHVFNQGKAPDCSLKTTDDMILAKCGKVGRRAVPGEESFFNPVTSRPKIYTCTTALICTCSQWARPGYERLSETR